MFYGYALIAAAKFKLPGTFDICGSRIEAARNGGASNYSTLYRNGLDCIENLDKLDLKRSVI